jgi:cytochrome c peroxidase
LRNVALRKTFFHNGLVHSLDDAVRFYVERDTRPEKWYPRDRHGRVLKFNDLPKQYWSNINTDPPFGGHPGDQPSLSPSEIRDIVAFLNTLTDGYKPETSVTASVACDPSSQLSIQAHTTAVIGRCALR